MTIAQKIVKAMSIFGGVQIITILCTIIRTKLIAVWIGPIGVGLFGIYNSVIEMVSAATTLSIRNSSVRDIASSDNYSIRNRIIATVRNWSWIVGILGAVVMMVAAPILSRFTFNDDNHTWGFVALSLVMILMAYAKGEEAVLQGTAKLAKLAKGTAIGAIMGVIASAPLFYFWREKSIIPTLIIFAAISALLMWWYSRKGEKSSIVKITLTETINRGKGFLKLGIYMTITSFISLLFAYLFIVYLNHTSDTTIVGYFNAGNNLVNKYVGLIFTAMAMEYYPRLAQAERSNNRMRIFVTQQINITILTLVPVIICFIIFSRIIVNILYSDQFYTIIPFITFAIIGTIFRAASWCIAFVILAKGNGKIYLVSETLSAVIGFALNIVFYNKWGIDGLGYAFTIWYIIYTIIVYIIYRHNFKLKLHISSIIYTATAFIIASTVAIAFSNKYYITTAIISIISTIMSAYIMLKITRNRQRSV
ncbi:MAG: oligosaccharide flippase family protein [Muribaculaceae bacterium]|nr:oligosaccharide flippase family protein [Muribaculaceae bacterium]